MQPGLPFPDPLESRPARSAAAPVPWRILAALALALLPLAISLGRPGPDVADQLRRSLDALPPHARVQLDRLGQPSLEDFLALVPGRKIESAWLPRDSFGHWALGSVVCLALVLLLGQTRRLPELWPAALGSATLGVTLVLGLQDLLLPHLADLLDGQTHFALSLCASVLGIGLIEETVKWLPVLAHQRPRRILDDSDALGLGLASGCGLGLAEAVLHAARSYNGVAGIDSYLVRFISCVGLHGLWTALTAVLWVRLLRMSRTPLDFGQSLMLFVLAVAGPALLHGLYDALLQYEQRGLALLVALASLAALASCFVGTHRPTQSAHI